MPRLLLEIGCEELPATTCRSITRELPNLFQERLATDIEDLYIGPRRVALLATVPESVETSPIVGPPQKIAFDEEGQPTKAALGFARKVGAEIDRLEIIDEVLTFQPGQQPIQDLLIEVVPTMIKGLSMPKPMIWDKHRLPFARLVLKCPAAFERRIAIS